MNKENSIVDIEYKEKYTKVYDSYLLDNNFKIGLVAGEIYRKRQLKKLPLKRDTYSYMYEIKAHNRLYNLGLFRSHTKDTDLEENIKKWKEILFRIIGR